MRTGASFVVRVLEDRRGQVSGVIERVATGAKEPFSNLEGIGRVIGIMLRDAPPSSSAGPGPTPSPGLARASTDPSGGASPRHGSTGKHTTARETLRRRPASPDRGRG